MLWRRGWTISHEQKTRQGIWNLLREDFKVKRGFLRPVLLSCIVLVVVAGVGVALYLSLSHQAKPHQVLVPGDTTTETRGPSSTVEPSFANPYPTYQAGSGSGIPRHSAWGEQLGSAVLRLYPSKDWQVLDAVETNVLTRVVIGPRQEDPSASFPFDGVPRLMIELAREERYTPDPQDFPPPHEEFATDYGHGMLTWHYGPDDSSIVSWFVRPDGLFLQVAAVQAQGDRTQPATLLLDQENVKKLIETVAAMIEIHTSTQ